MRLQRLQLELSRLQDREAQIKKYQQRSVESLQQELEMHEDEVANLSCKVEAATSNEMDWVTHLTEAILLDRLLIHSFGCALWDARCFDTDHCDEQVSP